MLKRKLSQTSMNRLMLVIGFALMGVAGFVDAVGYLRYFQMFAANMSGNHIRLGIALFKGHTSEMALRATPIVAFAIGALSGELMAGETWRMARLRAIVFVWLVEAGLLASVIVGDRLFRAAAGRDLLLLGMLAMAMGLQNTTMRRMGALTIYTTHVTGALTSACISTADLMRSLFARRWSDAARRSCRRAAWMTLLLANYVAGAVAGVAALEFARMTCLAIPAGVLALLAIGSRAVIASGCRG